MKKTHTVASGRGAGPGGGMCVFTGGPLLALDIVSFVSDSGEGSSPLPGDVRL